MAAFKRRIVRPLRQRQRQPVGGRHADQRRAAHLHGADGVGGIFQRGEAQNAVARAAGRSGR